MALPVTTTKDDFEHWLAAMDDHLEEFIALMPEQVRDRLDFSPASLDLVEQWILDRYPNTEAMLVEGESKVVNRLACYIGETFRKTLGGRWSIRLDDPKFAYFGLPILIGGKGLAAPVCPLTLATASADRRRGNYMRTILEYACKR